MFRVRTLLLICSAALSACATSPPVQEMSDARQAITAAQEAAAAQRAPELLGEAQRYLQEAEQHLREESYGQARINALRAKNRAVEALEIAEASAVD